MPRDELNERLSAITTFWSLLRQSQKAGGTEATAAQQFLLQRYGPAVRRYLLSAVRDPHAADELAQEFGLLLISGSFRHASPDRGRFRNYVKSVLFHLVAAHRRRTQATPQTRAPDSPEMAALAAPPDDLDRGFNEECRDHLLAWAWDALAEAEPTWFRVLRFRADHPEARSPEMARELSRQLDKPVTADWVRQTLHRAREQFADLLLDEVARSLETPTPEQVEEELAELNLLTYCQPALDRYHFPGPA